MEVWFAVCVQVRGRVLAAMSAEEFKKKGNDAFKDKRWDDAIENYNKAISLEPNQARILRKKKRHVCTCVHVSQLQLF